ncbi:MAG TPA: hypothetical protein VFC50_02900, partial [Candidatus Dormibacteraeota bacterium]|nr:hypothetical protein [Candidatus Dormibacteraeota bacterium]
FGINPNDPERVSIGELYDSPGQVFEPEADVLRSGGLRSMDSRHADTSLVTNKVHKSRQSNHNGCLLIKTEAQTYWVEAGVMLSVEETVRTGNPVAELVTDSEPRIMIDGHWKYKPAGAEDGPRGWKDAGKVMSVAVDGYESDNRQTIEEHDAEGTLYQGFESAIEELATVNIDPGRAIDLVLESA